MNIKRWLNIFFTIQLILLITGCGEKMEVEDKTKTSKDNSSDIQVDEESPWYSSYNLEGQKIIIAVANEKSDKPHKELKYILEITTKNEIEDIKNVIDISSWKLVPTENRAKGEPYFYLIIGEDTIISMYSDNAYGRIGNYTVKDGYYDISNYSDDYYLSEELFIKLWEILEPYQDNLDVAPYNMDKQ